MALRTYPCTIVLDRDGVEIRREDLPEQEAFRQFAAAKNDTKVFSVTVHQQMPSGDLRAIRGWERS